MGPPFMSTLGCQVGNLLQSITHDIMAQVMATTPEVIYDTLVADTQFMSYVGEYTFASDDTVPSIIIATPGKDLPSVKSQQGLEVVIHDIADVNSRLSISDASVPVYIWKVFIIVWEPATGSDVVAATSRILAKFPKATSIDTIAISSNIGAAVQTQIRIPSDCPILG